MAERRLVWRILMLAGEGIALAGGLSVAVGAALPWAEFTVFRMPIFLPGIVLGGAFTLAAAAAGLALLRRVPLLTAAMGVATVYLGFAARNQVGEQALQALIHLNLSFVTVNARLAQIGVSGIDPVPSLKRPFEYLGPGIAYTLYGGAAITAGASARILAELASRRCRACGLVWKVRRLADLRFCPRCGANADLPRGGHACLECRHAIHRTDHFCAHCGAPVITPTASEISMRA